MENGICRRSCGSYNGAGDEKSCCSAKSGGFVGRVNSFAFFLVLFVFLLFVPHTAESISGQGPNGEDIWMVMGPSGREHEILEYTEAGSAEYLVKREYLLSPEKGQDVIIGYVDGDSFRMCGGTTDLEVQNKYSHLVIWDGLPVDPTGGAGRYCNCQTEVYAVDDEWPLSVMPCTKSYDLDLPDDTVYEWIVKSNCTYTSVFPLYLSYQSAPITTTPTPTTLPTPTTPPATPPPATTTVPTTAAEITTGVAATLPPDVTTEATADITTGVAATLPPDVTTEATADVTTVDGATTTPEEVVETCGEGNFALELMIYVEDSYEMHNQSIAIIASELPAFVDSLPGSFKGAVRVGFSTYGDKPREPHGQPSLDYCFGSDVGLFTPLSTYVEGSTSAKISELLAEMKAQQTSGRDYQEDLLGAVHQVTLSTDWDHEDIDMKLRRILRVNLVLTHKMWHEEGDATSCTCKGDVWGDYDCVEWVCEEKIFPKHPGFVLSESPADQCLQYDYINQTVFTEAMKAKRVATMVFVTALDNPTVFEAYHSLSRSVKLTTGVNMYAEQNKGGSLSEELNSFLDRYCTDVDRWNDEIEDICTVIEPKDENGDTEMTISHAAYARKLREASAELFPSQPFFLV